LIEPVFRVDPAATDSGKSGWVVLMPHGLQGIPS
jgi:hypothetical protein